MMYTSIEASMVMKAPSAMASTRVTAISREKDLRGDEESKKNTEQRYSELQRFCEKKGHWYYYAARTKPFLLAFYRTRQNS